MQPRLVNLHAQDSAGKPCPDESPQGPGMTRLSAARRLRSAQHWLQRCFRHWPCACFLCGAPAAPGSTLCPWCRQALPQAGAPEALALALQHALPAPGPEELIAAFAYEYPVNRLIRHLKYSAGLALAPLLADALVQAIAARRRQDPQAEALPQRLFAVPLSRQRQRQRGYNQSWEIARHLSQALAIPLSPGLVRVRHTPPQAGLNAQQRQHNLTSAFALKTSVQGLDVALVDDVYTTGATLATLAHLLRQQGARRVRAWVVACTPAPDFVASHLHV